jgi:hypothetical protein
MELKDPSIIEQQAKRRIHALSRVSKSTRHQNSLWNKSMQFLSRAAQWLHLTRPKPRVHHRVHPYGQTGVFQLSDSTLPLWGIKQRVSGTLRNQGNKTYKKRDLGGKLRLERYSRLGKQGKKQVGTLTLAKMNELFKKAGEL